MQIREITATTFTRPSDTTAYTSGDLIANSTTAGSVTPMTFNTGSRGLKLWRVALARSATSVTNASFRLHLYKDLPTVANGDNGAFSGIVAGYLGFVDIDGTAPAFTDSARAHGTPTTNSNQSQMYIVPDVDNLIYGLLEARGAYTPASGETFTVSLIGESYL